MGDGEISSSISIWQSVELQYCYPYPVYNPPGYEVHLGVEDKNDKKGKVKGNYGGVQLVDWGLGNQTQA